MKKIFVVSPKQNKFQTIFAAHMAVALSGAFKTALVETSPKNDALQMFLAKRCHEGLKKNIDLSVPAYFKFEKNIFKNLEEEYAFLVADAQNFENIESCDVLVVMASDDQDIEALANQNGAFANMIWAAKKNRAKTGKDAFKCVVLPYQNLDIRKLEQTLPMMGYVIGPKWEKNQIFIDGFQTGVTALDKNLPAFKKEFRADDFFARRNLKKIIEFIC